MPKKKRPIADEGQPIPLTEFFPKGREHVKVVLKEIKEDEAQDKAR